jgi:hypothetical protein
LKFSKKWNSNNQSESKVLTKQRSQQIYNNNSKGECQKKKKTKQTNLTILVQGFFIIFQEFKEGVFQVNYYFLILNGHGCMSHKGYKINTIIWFDNA